VTAKSMAVNFSKKLWKGPSVLLLGQMEATQVTQLREAGVGKSAHAFSLTWLFLEYEGLVPGGLEERQRSHILWHFSWLGSRSQTCSCSQVLQPVWGAKRKRDLEKQQPDSQPILLKFSKALPPPFPLVTWLAHPLCTVFAGNKDTKPTACLVLQPKLSGC